MTNDLIIRVEYEGTTYDLPVDNDVPLRVEMSAVESQELGKLFGIGSQTFNLPGTKEINKFFKHAYDVSVDDIPAMYNTLPCSVILNGETVLIGALQLLEVISSDDGYVTYNVQVTDKVVQFQQALSSKLIKNADWSAFDHTLDSGSVVSSWSDGLLSGSIFYPFVDYGRQDTDIYPDVPRIQFGTTSGSIGSATTPMQTRQFLPAIKLSDVMDTIFDQVGFGYTGSFTATDDWNNLYVLTKASDELGPVLSGSSFPTFEAGAFSNQTEPEGSTDVPIEADFEISDPQNNYNPTTYTYTVPTTGEYAIDGRIGFFNPAYSPGIGPVRITCKIVKYDGIVTSTIATNNIIVDYFDGIGPHYVPTSFLGNLDIGDEVQLYLDYEQVAAGTTPGPVTLLQYATDFQCTKAPIAYDGQTVYMGLQWDSTAKSIDFVKGLLQQFNLIMVPQLENRSIIEIHQFDDWIRSGEIKDWTYKYDTAKRISINHTIDELPKEVFLKGDDDVDRFSKQTIDQAFGQQYGTLRILADNNISQGEGKVGDYFMPPVLGAILQTNATGSDGSFTYDLDLSSTVALPHLYKFDNNKQVSYQFKPRLGYKVSNTIPAGQAINIGTALGYTAVTGSYSTIANVSQLPVISTTTDLLFNNTFTPFNTTLGLNNGINNFTRYWETYYESLYWEGSKKVTLDLYFEPYEYKQIKLNDRILIKNQMYRINKISGFNISSRDVVTVELIKLYPEYSSR